MSRLLLAILAFLVAALFMASLLIGPAGLGLGESLAALFRGEGQAVVSVMPLSVSCRVASWPHGV